MVTPEQIGELDELTRETAQIIASPSTPEHTLFDVVGTHSVEAHDILPNVAQALNDLAVHGTMRAVLVHLPEETSDCYGPTPPYYRPYRSGDEHYRPKKLYPSDIYRALLISMPTSHGEKGLYAYTSRRFSTIQNNIYAIKTWGDFAYSSPNPSEQNLHTEGVFQNFNYGMQPIGRNRNSSPDFLSLHYIRNYEEAPLEVSIPEFDKLSEETLRALSGPAVRLEAGHQQVPILYGSPDDWWIRYNHLKFTNDPERVPDPLVRQCLEELDAHLDEKRRSLAVHAGTIAILDNRRLLHRRPAYKPDPDGTGRWQRRVALSASASRIEDFLIRERVIDPGLLHRELPIVGSPGAEANPNL